MGAQSFDPAVLRSLERLHAPDSVRRAMAAARAAGYVNVNLDLIYGAHGETLESWERTLAETIALAPEHVSAYALTIEPATPLGRAVARGDVPEPDPDTQADMFQLACSMLRDAGYGHYEVSNWARPGYECRHNLGYWRRQPYVGLGAGAHSYRDDRRWWNVRPPEEYLATVERGELPVGGEETLEASDAYLEEVFLRLRILEGVPASWIDDDRADPYLEGGLLTDDDGSLVPTERGMLLLNELVLGLTAGESAPSLPGLAIRSASIEVVIGPMSWYSAARRTVRGRIECSLCRRCVARAATRPSTSRPGRAATRARRAARSGGSWSAARAGRASTASPGRPPGRVRGAACCRKPRAEPPPADRARARRAAP